MADPKTWVDVTDTAVTIGLAALIGGGIGIIGSWINSRRQADKEYLKRKRELLEIVLQQFDGFAEAQSVYWADLANAVYKRDKKDPADALTKTDCSALKEGEQKLFDCYRHLLTCRSRLLLVGEKDAVAALKEFKECADTFFKRANIDNSNCTKEFMDEHRKTLAEAKDKFYDALKDAYVRRN